jgi:hypothetical protein
MVEFSANQISTGDVIMRLENELPFNECFPDLTSKKLRIVRWTFVMRSARNTLSRLLNHPKECCNACNQSRNENQDACHTRHSLHFHAGQERSFVAHVYERW